jgi:hypothetical protein
MAEIIWFSAGTVYAACNPLILKGLRNMVHKTDMYGQVKYLISNENPDKGLDTAYAGGVL